MSGHSKWSTIKHQKEAKDKKRGNIFTKLSRVITVAVIKGGSADSETNFSLRLAIDRARAANMPKENIQKAIDRAGSKGGEGGQGLTEVVYEGFGPHQIALVIEALTDNTNRTVAELKKLLERGGGSLASPGSTSYLFEKMGLLAVAKKGDIETMMLKLIDLGAEDVGEKEEEIIVYTKAENLGRMRDQVALEKNFEITRAEIVMRPKVVVKIPEVSKSKKIQNFLDSLEEHDDVQRVFANIG
ncbi:MAG: YebC/PmpR family DNA-binding transcriptional regulator [Candidatus Pacebacteria bacterium]|nr:YebC/PmpR family DNA-binding transcriptional regulator [Candidatus Paceibacterota bacterium]